MALDCDNTETNSNYGEDLLKFLYCLRKLVQDKNVVICVTIPSHLFEVRTNYKDIMLINLMFHVLSLMFVVPILT